MMQNEPINEDDEPLLPKRVQHVIDRCFAGEVMVKQLRETGPEFWFWPSGDACGPASAQEAIDTGLLKPGKDGLFGGPEAQTWRACL